MYSNKGEGSANLNPLCESLAEEEIKLVPIKNTRVSFCPSIKFQLGCAHCSVVSGDSQRNWCIYQLSSWVTNQLKEPWTYTSVVNVFRFNYKSLDLKRFHNHWTEEYGPLNHHYSSGLNRWMALTATHDRRSILWRSLNSFPFNRSEAVIRLSAGLVNEFSFSGHNN